MFAKLRQDLKYATLTSLRQPVISVGIILTITVVVGATTAIFSAVNTLLIRPLPYPNSERLVSISAAEDRADAQHALLMPLLLKDLQTQSGTVQKFWGFSPTWPVTLTNQGNPSMINATYTTPGVMDGLGFNIVSGRDFLPDEQITGGERVALVTKAFWKSRFGSNAAIGQQVITLDSENYRIVGIVDDQKRLPTVESDVYLPFSLNDYTNSRVAPVMNIIGSLREGATLSQAQSEMDRITRSVQKDYPSLREKRLVVTSLRELMVGDIRSTLLILFAAGGFLVLIACVNIANLLLSRAMGREREISLRTALGATRHRLIQQLLTESLFLAFIGGLLGLVLAYVIVFQFIPHIPFDFALSQDIRIDGTVLAFTFTLSLLTGLIFGLVPALHAAKPNLITSLKTQTKSNIGASGRQLWSSLVVAEVALSIVVLLGAGLLIRSFWRLSHVDPGFRTSHILTMNVFLPDARYTNAKRANFHDQLMERIKTLPGIQSAGIVNRLPLSGTNLLVGVTVEGSPTTAGKPEMIDRRVADPDYFHTIGIPLFRGRYFTTQDNSNSLNVAIVNEVMARRFWPHEDPIGHRAVLAAQGGVPVTIVGVVGNILHHGLDAQAQPELYVPYAQSTPEAMVVVMLTNQPAGNLVHAIREQIWALDPQIPLDNLQSMDQVVATSISHPRFRTIILSSFAVLALLLSAIGIYSVVSYSTSRRSSEIGIRMALGAQRASILMLIVGQGVKLVLLGVAIGTTASFVLTQFLRKFLYGVSGTDPITLIGVSSLMIVVALVACYVPARRALQGDPLAALRVE